MGAETIALLATAASAGGSYFGNKYGADKQADLAKGLTQQEMAMRQMYGNGLSTSTPDLFKYFNSNMPNANSYFSPSNVNRSFDTASGNLNRTALGAGANAAQQAGAMANAYGLANKAGFTSNAYQNTLGSYAPQFGELETGRANALNQNQSELYRALMSQFGMGAQAKQGDFQNQFDISKFIMGG